MTNTVTLQQAYDVLDVSPLEDFAAIRAAWVRKVKTFHPDVWHGAGAEATRRMMALNDAYDMLAKHHKQIKAQHEADIKAALEARRAAERKAAARRAQANRAPSAPPRKAQRSAVAQVSAPSPVAKDFAQARRILNRKDTVTELAVL